MKKGRTSARRITLFDGVGVATEDFSALRWLRKLSKVPSDLKCLICWSIPMFRRTSMAC
ncbi:hypothetical protein [Agrobacterium tumefaciens]|uniref:hypothetical protein n=1 Tax=Agrobacterium tumefaciens TaxID=358 RepID=UPI00389931FD